MQHCNRKSMTKSRQSDTAMFLTNETLLHTDEFLTETRSSAVLEVLDWFIQCKPVQASEEVWLACQTALMEGFDNAVRHAHKHLPSETPIVIKIAVHQQAVNIQIWDQGHPTNFDALLQNTPKTVNITAESGRGLMLMQHIADRLTYERTPDQKNCLSIVRMF